MFSYVYVVVPIQLTARDMPKAAAGRNTENQTQIHEKLHRSNFAIHLFHCDLLRAGKLHVGL